MSYDVIVVGGGPAGLAAGLVLGRARRQVLVADEGAPRNACASVMHGFVTRDGASLEEFRETARAQLRHYLSVELRDLRVQSIQGLPEEWDVRLR
jgi:thioredoxin reductase